MSNIVLTCPLCQFTKEVTKSSIPQNAQWVTCPKCQKRFLLAPLKAKPSRPLLPARAATGIELGGDLRKSQNLQFVILFLLMFLVLFGGRLYSSSRALNTPSPNFIAASENGIATLWLNQVMITDQEGTLVRKVDIPENIEPTQILWAGDELWVADYRTKGVLIVDANNQRWLEFKGSKVSAHFKVAPDFSKGCIFVSNGAGHNLLVYDLQGNFRSSFGREGRNPGELMFPNQFLLEESGNLLIANTKSPAIDRFSPEGQFLARVATPMGDENYRYPTNVALAPDRIVTLEADGYLQDGRIALYTLHGEYLGSQEPVKDFKLIGDIAVWGDRVFATDLSNAKVYAFAAEDLRFLGEYSSDLKRLGEKYQKDFRFWDNLSSLCLWGLLAILVPLIYFYARFRKNQADEANAQAVSNRAAVETLPVNSKNSRISKDLNSLKPLDYIAIETKTSVDILALLLLGISFLGMQWISFSRATFPKETIAGVMLIGMISFGAGILLSLRTSWGCPVALKKARKLLEKLVRNQGRGVLEGVEKVGIGHSTNKSTFLLLMAPRHLIVTEFNVFGRLRNACRVTYDGIFVEEKRYLLPALVFGYGGKKKVLTAISKDFIARLYNTLESYRDQYIATEGVSCSQRKKPLATETKRPFNRKAALLSVLFPGLGQFYKRHLIRGALFMVLFIPVVLSIAINFEPILAGAIDWAPASIIGMVLVLSYGSIVFAINIWDALRGQ